MSSTNRGAPRSDLDFYETPAWATRAILPHLPIWDGTSVLDAGAGTGAITRAVREQWPAAWIEAVELDPGRAGEAGKVADRCHLDDFLTFDVADLDESRADVVIGNPPYNKAAEFIDKALQITPRVCFLLRLNYLGSQKRAAWHRAHPADIYVLPKRPSFTGRGTDSVEYAWFVWGLGGGRWRVLEVNP